MNTQQLKELAKLADSEVTWILLPKDLANEGWCTEVVNYISVVSPSTITALVDRIEAAGRELDELRAEVNRLDTESQRLSDQLGACDRERLVWIKLALTSEAELARRDAAAGDPVGEAVEWKHPTEERRVDFRWIRYVPAGTKLYTTAPPAVLPPVANEREAFNTWNNDDNLPIAGVPAKNAAWLAWQARAALGAQQQKPVDMRHIGHATVQVSGQRYPYLDKGDVLHAFKEMGIRIRTKDSDPAEGVEVTL